MGGGQLFKCNPCLDVLTVRFPFFARYNSASKLNPSSVWRILDHCQLLNVMRIFNG